MAALTQTKIDELVNEMNQRYQPSDGRCLATPAQMNLLLDKLEAYTEEVQEVASEEGLDDDTNVAQWSLDMAAWQQRMAHYRSELDEVPRAQWHTSQGCEAIYQQVTAPLLDGVFYEILPGIVLSEEEKASILAGGPSNPKPNDVITPFTLGNQVLVYQQHQAERARKFWEDLLNEANALAKKAKKAVQQAGKLALPWGVALIGVAAVVGVGYLFVKSRKPARGADYDEAA